MKYLKVYHFYCLLLNLILDKQNYQNYFTYTWVHIFFLVENSNHDFFFFWDDQLVESSYWTHGSINVDFKRV